mmetsp:Transcript_9077/g.19467  ORF Transcript_9077/g.19467 Transcript_9077/m.19467 type:complete len:189 (+) Transcript_9077:110-676(+)
MAEDRKARLAALAARAGRNSKPATSSSSMDEEGGGSEPSDKGPALRFRNYAPKDASLDEQAAAADTATAAKTDASGGPMTKRQRTGETLSTSSTAAAKNGKETSALEEAMKQAQAEASALAGVGGEGSSAVLGNNLAAMAPKKVNWDLKRDIQGKLDKLERRTQRALVDLLKERLEKEAEDEGYDGLD